MIEKLNYVKNEIPFYAEQITKSKYKSFLGIPTENEYSDVLEKFDSFFDEDLIIYLRNVVWESSLDDTRALFYLKAYLIGQWYSYKTRDTMDKITQVQVKKRFEWNNKSISLRQAKYSLGLEENVQLNNLVKDEIKTSLNPVVFNHFEKLDQVSNKLNYSNFLEAADDIRRYSAKELAEETEHFITATDDLFTEEIEQYVSKYGYLFNTVDEINLFTVKRSLEDMKYLIRNMGWITKGISIAWSKSGQKYSNSFCVPMSIPGDIVLVTSDNNGFNSHRHLYHEFGHGFHFMNTDEKLSYEFRRMGDNAVAEAYSALIESLNYNSHWLEKRGYKNPEVVKKHAYFHRVYMIRKYWGKLKSEIEIHESKKYNEYGKDIFNKHCTRALNNKFDDLWWAYMMDDEFNAATQIRAWSLSAQINEYLISHYGESWFDDPEAGRCLSTLFSYGYKYNADEISELLGYKQLDSNSLVKELKQNLLDVKL